MSCKQSNRIRYLLLIIIGSNSENLNRNRIFIEFSLYKSENYRNEVQQTKLQLPKEDRKKGPTFLELTFALYCSSNARVDRLIRKIRI